MMKPKNFSLTLLFIVCVLFNTSQTMGFNDDKSDLRSSVDLKAKNSGIGHKLFIIAIGISKYNNPQYQFDNCDDDAILFASTVEKAFSKNNPGSSGQVQTWLLLNTDAT